MSCGVGPGLASDPVWLLIRLLPWELKCATRGALKKKEEEEKAEGCPYFKEKNNYPQRLYQVFLLISALRLVP